MWFSAYLKDLELRELFSRLGDGGCNEIETLPLLLGIVWKQDVLRPWVQAGEAACLTVVHGAEEFHIDSTGDDLRRLHSQRSAHLPVLYDNCGGQRRQQITRGLEESADGGDMAVRRRP